MSRWGKIDTKGIEALQKKMQALDAEKLDAFCKTMAKELAARLLRKVKKRTPVGNYAKGSGKMGGTLRRGWTIDAEVVKKGEAYEITVFNAVEYASYVEFGHRTANHKGWVMGRFMMTKSEIEVQGVASKIIEKRLMEILGSAFNGK